MKRFGLALLALLTSGLFTFGPTTRTTLTFSANQIAGTASATLATVNQSRGFTGLSGVQSYTVDNGTTLHCTDLVASLRSGAAAVQWSLWQVLVSNSGAVTASSEPVISMELETPSATSGVGNQPATFSIPDGFEVRGNGTRSIGLVHTDSATTNVDSVNLVCFFN